jgi:hypothetical protein
MLALTTFCALLKPCGGQEKQQDDKWVKVQKVEDYSNQLQNRRTKNVKDRLKI